MLTIEAWLKGIGLKHSVDVCPSWPPDLYALAGTLLRRSGAYLRVFEHREVQTAVQPTSRALRRLASYGAV
jgi:hypothetical protein